MYWWKVWVVAHWGSRDDSVDKLAERTTDCLRGLTGIHKRCRRWYASKPGEDEVDINVSTIRQIILDRANYKLRRGETADLLTHGIELCTGTFPEDWLKFWLRDSGGRIKVAPNWCRLDLPGGADNEKSLLHWETLLEMLEVFAKAWEPSWGEVMATELFDRTEEHRPDTPEPSWMLYLPKERGDLPPLPKKYAVRKVNGLGSIVVTTRERFDASRQEHLDAVDELMGILREANLLQPVSMD